MTEHDLDLVKAGNALRAIVETTMTDSCTTWSEDPGCFHCDDPFGAPERDEQGHTADCPALAAVRAWARALGEGGAK